MTTEPFDQAAAVLAEHRGWHRCIGDVLAWGSSTDHPEKSCLAYGLASLLAAAQRDLAAERTKVQVVRVLTAADVVAGVGGPWAHAGDFIGRRVYAEAQLGSDA